MLITNQIKDLVSRIEDNPNSSALVHEMVGRLQDQAILPENIERYEQIREPTGELGKYPTDDQGFAASFDPILDEKTFINTWQKYGIVVGKNVVAKNVRKQAVHRMRQIALDLSEGKWDLADSTTYHKIPEDTNSTPFLSRGFFEMYHDASIADIRQSIRLFLHNTLLWGTPKLWTTFDRLGVKLPDHKESYALPLHVDQNPLIHPDFKTIQGVLALEDCPLERGTFVGVPGSKSLFPSYARFAKEGDFVELDLEDRGASILQSYAQPFPLRGGDIVNWDSRTTHSNTANVSWETRFVAYISAGPANESDSSVVEARNEALRTGMGSNVRGALMHASKPPRYTDERGIQAVRVKEELTPLGELVYGVNSYDSLQS